MIKKLDLLKMFNERQTDAQWNKSVETTVNLLIDAVNELQATISKKENVELADPYAEQRRWIGKVCWFWDDDNTNSSCGILTSIDTETFKEPQFVCNDEYDYGHCEPVKPDDDIIYKKEQQ